MKILAVVCQKGGTAKTTTVINLAVEAQAQGQEVLIIDLDPQVSACAWKDIRGEAAPVVASVPVPHLERTLKVAEENGVDLVIIDTAGRANDATTAAAGAADACLIPMAPSLIDLKTLNTTLAAVRASGQEVELRVLLTRVRAFGSRHEETAGWLAEQEHMGVCPIMLGERVTYQDAFARGQGVTEMEPGGKAAQEIRELYKYTCQLLDKSNTRTNHDEKARSPAKRPA